jgi:hypothetical protein
MPAHASVSTYLKLFRDIFDNNGQLKHYDMMMKSAAP